MSLTRQITICLAIGAMVTFLTVGLMTFWMAKQHDIESASATRTMVTGGLASARHKLEALTNDYAWWDEAYQAYYRDDRGWIDANIGTGITGTEIADALVIVSPEGEFKYGWALEGGEAADAIVSKDIIKTALDVTRNVPVDRAQARTILARGPSGVLMVGAAPITPVETTASADKSKMPVLIMAQYLNEDRLGELGRSFLLQDLSVSDDPIDGQDSFALTDASGATIADLTWTPPKPGEALLRTAAMPLAGALGVFTLTVFLIGFRARTLASALSWSEQQANIAARRDHLTGLSNRKGLSELLGSKQCRLAAKRGELAVIYLDINGFKGVNDSVGHHGGDQLVREIAERFVQVLPAGSLLARVGGDEFVVALVGVNAANVAGVAAMLSGALGVPFNVCGVEFHVSCAVGYTTTATGDAEAEELIRQADMAMYQAKGDGVREPLGYMSSMETGALEKKQFENHLWNAFQAGELEVFYQPIARSHDMAVTGLEALIRWNSPELGYVSPAKLIAAAEESGLIRDIGDFVLDRVCSDMRHWPDLRVSVNVSPMQLRDPSYPAGFQKILKRHRVMPHQIEIELTENVLIDDPDAAARKLAELRKLGVTVALDDFGTGFSSIGALRSFPLDRIKIDRSFVQEMTTSPESVGLVRALVAVADSMKLDVVSEGVETAEQAHMMRLCGCEYLQGYLLSRPVPAASIVEILRAAPPAEAAAGNTSSLRRVS